MPSSQVSSCTHTHAPTHERELVSITRKHMQTNISIIVARLCHCICTQLCLSSCTRYTRHHRRRCRCACTQHCCSSCTQLTHTSLSQTVPLSMHSTLLAYTRVHVHTHTYACLYAFTRMIAPQGLASTGTYINAQVRTHVQALTSGKGRLRGRLGDPSRLESVYVYMQTCAHEFRTYASVCIRTNACVHASAFFVCMNVQMYVCMLHVCIHGRTSTQANL